MNTAEQLDQEIDHAVQQFHKQYGARKDDYYGLIFFENVLQVPRATAFDYVTFGNHDLGIDGFYFDKEQQQLRIFQFKNSKSPKLFADSLSSLTDHGLRALFGDYVAVPGHQPIVDSARRVIAQSKDEIAEIFVDFVFRGNPQEAETSAAISNLKDRLEESANWLVERYFEEPRPLKVRFLCFDRLSLAATTDRFEVHFRNYVKFPGPDGMHMYIGFLPLLDLYGIRTTLGRKFLERNIRFALPPDGHVNRALSDTFALMLLKQTHSPTLFPFHHNGITLSVGVLEEKSEDVVVVYKPRLLNGAQTVSTFADFWERNSPALRTVTTEKMVAQLLVPCRVITNANSQSITQITISNNRQNPVQSWQLHANDDIQFELEDWFKQHGIPYQRQVRSFAKIAAEEWQSMEYKETRPVELIRLARTYLAAEGELGKLSHINDVFENQRDYSDLFGSHRLNADHRQVLICYKSQYHLPRLAQEIKEKGKLKYDFVNRTRDIIWALTCQAVLNDPKGETFLDSYGNDLSRPHSFNERLRELASTRVRFLLDELTNDKEYKSKAEDGNYSFMRSPGAFKKAMKYAGDKWGWKPKQLR